MQEIEGKFDKGKCTCLCISLPPLLPMLMASFLPNLIEALLANPSSFSLARLEQTLLCFIVESVLVGRSCV